MIVTTGKSITGRPWPLLLWLLPQELGRSHHAPGIKECWSWRRDSGDWSEVSLKVWYVLLAFPWRGNCISIFLWVIMSRFLHL